MVNISNLTKAAPLKPRILVAPLDWGLGHATRCIPIINELLAAGAEVMIASEGPQKALLSQEFPGLRFIELSGYRLRYGKKGWMTLLKIIFQIPKILIQIKRENRWLNNFLLRERLDAVISDNRYGLYSQALVSVFITHQLRIKTPFGKNIERKLSQINYRYINRFSFCWIPDFNGRLSLAGELAHPSVLPVMPIRYLGALTRFNNEGVNMEKESLLVLLSGPEPQRSIFEKIILKELGNNNIPAVLVRGLPAETELPRCPAQVTVHNHLPAAALNTLICQSAWVISRSGYSTVMDLLSLGKKCILVPTPGQPEQEYLAEYLETKKLALRASQKNLVLPAAIEAAKRFPFIKYERSDQGLLRQAVGELFDAIKQAQAI